jgi:coenzyme Q-binding protein COQ10
MPTFRTTRRVRHAATDMFDLVADMDRYPEFVPLCERMRVRGRTQVADGVETATAAMTVAYKLISETFTTRVTLNRPELWIKVEYLDGPFSILDNRWSFKPLTEESCEVEFFIRYEFKSRVLGLVMGAMFDVAFRRFEEAFERRADVIYGHKRPATA